MSRKARLARAASFVGLIGLLVALWYFPFYGGQRFEDDGTPTEFATDGTRLAGTAALIERLRDTHLLNELEIYEALGLEGADPEPRESSLPLDSLLTRDPYKPRFRETFTRLSALSYPLPEHPESYRIDAAESEFSFYGQEPVLRWYSERRSNTAVCAVRFTDPLRQNYRLRTFPDRVSALEAGYLITHRSHCGTCSSLKNLVVYLDNPDLTTPGRTCAARNLTLIGIKACLMDAVGFEERCAESWAYNARHSRRYCMGVCVKQYGLWNIMSNNMGSEHTDERGVLNPCIACDEYTSGPGFQFAAGRTRRNSGITSAIRRSASEVYTLDHSVYFR